MQLGVFINGRCYACQQAFAVEQAQVLLEIHWRPLLWGGFGACIFDDLIHFTPVKFRGTMGPSGLFAKPAATVYSSPHFKVTPEATPAPVREYALLMSVRDKAHGVNRSYR